MDYAKRFGSCSFTTVSPTNMLFQGAGTYVSAGLRSFGSSPTFSTTGTSGSLTIATILESTGNTVDVAILNNDADPFAGFEGYASPNWDGYGAEPITQDTVDAGRALLSLLPREWRAPAIAPAADGSIGFEWDREDGPIRTVFVDIGPGKEWRSYWRKDSGERGFTPRQRIDRTTAVSISDLFRRLSV
jgi:hypothetical protein